MNKTLAARGFCRVTMDIRYLFTAVYATLLTLVLVKESHGLECNKDFTTLEAGTLKPLSGYLHIGNHILPPQHFQTYNDTHFRVCICEVRKCLRKCCPENWAYDSTLICAYNHAQPTDFEVEIRSENGTRHNALSIHQFHVHFASTCLEQFQLNEEDEYYLTDTGKLRLYNPDLGQFVLLERDEFCLENALDDNGTKTIVEVCNRLEHPRNIVNQVGMLISLPFFALTFIAYICMPELRNVPGKTLMSYVIAMGTSYLFHVILSFLYGEALEEFCVPGAYLIHYFSLAAFFWMNVLSYDIWSVFRTYSWMRNRTDAKKFVMYSLYAWGCPSFFTISMMAVQFSPSTSEHLIRPEIGYENCAIKSLAAGLIYYFAPISVILLINATFFVNTAWKIYSFSRETTILNEEGNHGRNASSNERFSLYLKLFLLMGVSWVMEVVSWLSGGEQKYWYATDIINTLQGLLIFIFFVCKKSTLRKLFKKLTKDSSSSNGAKKTHTSSTDNGDMEIKSITKCT